jgi:hypothetical protein
LACCAHYFPASAKKPPPVTIVASTLPYRAAMRIEDLAG